MYLHNPKTDKSGIICCIPQTGKCPNGCKDCFFQSGRSYLEPLKDNLPNMPSLELARNKIVRCNDGNDSHYQQDLVIEATKNYPNKFFNTSCPDDFEKYPAPVVLTVNPGKMTDVNFHKIPLPLPNNLMAVRARVNVWNLNLIDEIVNYYVVHDIAVFLTFMAYHIEDEIPEFHKEFYVYRDRTLNKYYAINDRGLEQILNRYKTNARVYLCGEGGRNKCKYCGNCLREYFYTKERMGL